MEEQATAQKNKDNKYETFTFEIKPANPHHEPVNPAERRPSSSSSASSSSSSTDSEEEDDDFIQLDANNNPDFGPKLKPVFDETASDDVSRRIPSSIFASQSKKVPTEWSVTSAESLFSLNFSSKNYRQGTAILNGVPPGSPMPTTPESAVSDMSLEGFGGVSVEVPGEKGSGAHVGVAKENVILNGIPPDSPMPTTPESAVSVVSDVSLEGFGGPVEIPGEKGSGAHVGVAKENEIDGNISSLQSFAFPVLTGDEKTESIKPESQPKPPPPTISRSESAKSQPEPESEPKPEPEPKPKPEPEPEPEILQPPEPQVMAAPEKEKTITDTVTTATTTTDDIANTGNATKTNAATSSGTGFFCCSCSFCS